MQIGQWIGTLEQGEEEVDNSAVEYENLSGLAHVVL